MISRRRFLAGLGATALAGCEHVPEEGVFNACLATDLPPDLAAHDVVAGAFDGIEPARLWDCHVHLLGVGDGGTGAWVNPHLRSPLHPFEFLRFEVFLRASCPGTGGDLDAGYAERLLACGSGLAPGARVVLLAFDYTYREDGTRSLEESAFHTPDRYARALAGRHPGRMEWAASVHPYRADALEALDDAAARGARAVKWLPPSMGIDPASARCDAFYERLRALGLPLLVHGGVERAVTGADRPEFGNPLRLRRALDHGARVVIAHCASLGESPDSERPGSPSTANIDLFARLMDDHRYESLLYGDISALVQRNRLGHPLDTVLDRDDWHPRLLHGSDYPLPGAVPLVSVGALAARGYLDAGDVEPLRRLRDHNPLLFDLALKRALSHNGRRFSPVIFDTARVLDAPRPA